MMEVQQFGSHARDARSVSQSLGRGFLQRCPSCGSGAIFRAFLKVGDACPKCGTELHHHRADDAPPYFTMLIVGHIVVPLALMLEQWKHPETWVHWMLWIPLTLILIFALLPRIKGALVGLQWALRMHGFDGEPDAVPVRAADRE